MILHDIAFLREQNQLKKTTPPPQTISGYIEGRRIMPSDTPFPGYWENWRTQYAVKIMDAMSPYSDIRYVDIMAAAQTIKSASVENVVGYYMGASPSPILYVSGTDSLLKKWASKRLEPLIDSLGIRASIRAPIDTDKSRSTGDTTFQKLFTGGFLEMASAQSPSSLRADSVKILILEECDSAPRNLTTGEGRWDLVVEARTKNWGHRKKIMAVSTPTIMGESLIHERFLLGGQHEYFVPCPHCGKEQILVRGSENGTYGLRADKKAGILQFVYYICEFCHGDIHEHHKNIMIPRGNWRNMAEPLKHRFSCHLSSLYSPVGMYSWIDYWDDYQRAIEDPEGLRSFTNLQDGLPYREVGSRQKLDRIVELKSGYTRGTVPNEVLYLTAGADVQRGMDKYRDLDDEELAKVVNDMIEDGKDPIDENVPRIELEILGNGSLWRTWSINYFTFFGKTDNHSGGAFQRLYEFLNDGGFKFKKANGKELSVETAFIDSGDGAYFDVVYSFCLGLKNIYPSKGFKSLGVDSKKNTVYDDVSEKDLIHYQEKYTESGQKVINVATHYYKSITYTNINKSIADKTINSNDRRFLCEFPSDYPDRYFKGIQAEERTSSGFVAHGRRNEPLDARVYALCAAEYWLDSMVKKFRIAARDRGASKEQQRAITSKYVIQWLEKEAGIFSEMVV